MKLRYTTVLAIEGEESRVTIFYPIVSLLEKIEIPYQVRDDVTWLVQDGKL